MKNQKKRAKSNKSSRNKTRQNQWWYTIIGLLLVIFIIMWLSRTGYDASQRSNSEPKRGVEKTKTINKISKDKIYHNIGLPKIANREFYFENEHGRYSFLYDTTLRQAVWVAHTLTAVEVSRKGVDRSNRFRSDPKVIERGFPSATDADYKKSGYDRGHLLPSADRDDTPEENSATFLLSNISPQRPNLNRKIWKSLEEYVRRVAEKYDSVWIVTGSKSDEIFNYIGKSRVGVPKYFYKTLLIKYSGKYYAIGFYIPNEDRFSGDFQSYAKTVDQLEEILSMDFYTGLDDSLQARAEGRYSTQIWFDKKLKK